MPRAGSRWRRLLTAAVLVLVGALLVCGPRAVAHDAVVVAVGHGSGPACGSPGDEGGLAPAVPPRPASHGELLPTPYGTRATAAGTWSVDDAAAGVRPERAPPWRVAPSPMDLSILRV
ncbi:hypothetical protein [Streptomyces sp. NPDC006368]|uniref:hypothetical protein n=1 Tax=Streptomyces sp. NPDC006368 TaxID=3156760 RepID=UPI0033BA1B47